MNTEIWGIVLGAIGTVVSVVTLATLIAKGVIGVEKRLSTLETKVELFWDSARGVVAQALMGKAPQNPVSEERWKDLLNRFRSNSLAFTEAEELRTALLEREKKAKEEKDAITLFAIGLGLALLAVLLAKK